MSTKSKRIGGPENHAWYLGYAAGIKGVTCPAATDEDMDKLIQAGYADGAAAKLNSMWDLADAPVGSNRAEVTSAYQAGYDLGYTEGQKAAGIAHQKIVMPEAHDLPFMPDPPDVEYREIREANPRDVVTVGNPPFMARRAEAAPFA